jgi:hypothetical protein
MSSGFGAKGSEGRCFPLWQDFSKVCSNAESRSSVCLLCLFVLRVLLCLLLLLMSAIE